MKRIIITSFLAIIFSLNSIADVNTDRVMSKILRDTKTYISSEARATTEDEAYETALQTLSARIADYLEKKDGTMPDAVYLNKVSRIYDKLTNKVSENRYRVILYVKKKDLQPIGDTTGSLVLTRGNEGEYKPISTTEPETVIVTDTVVQVVERPIAVDPTVSTISQCPSGKELPALLKSLRDGNKISAASAFPITKIDDFYIAVIRNNKVISVLKHTPEGWINAITLESAVPNMPQDCAAFWFTL